LWWENVHDYVHDIYTSINAKLKSFSSSLLIFFAAADSARRVLPMICLLGWLQLLHSVGANYVASDGTGYWCYNKINQYQVDTLADCEEGSAALGWDDQIVDGYQRTYPYFPPACYIESPGNELKYNYRKTSTASQCDSGGYTCLCWAGLACSNKNGTKVNENTCGCGTTTCTPNSGLFCRENLNYCGKESEMFVQLSGGSCASAGTFSILTKDDCYSGSKALNWGRPDVTPTWPSNTLISGCSGYDRGDQLRFVEKCASNQPCVCWAGALCENIDGTAGNGVDCKCGESICT
jgi:hypothetical protein